MQNITTSFSWRTSKFSRLIVSHTDLLHLIENTFDRKRIYANPSFYLNSNPDCNTNPNPKAQLCYEWRHFSIKCTDSIFTICNALQCHLV